VFVRDFFFNPIQFEFKINLKLPYDCFLYHTQSIKNKLKKSFKTNKNRHCYEVKTKCNPLKLSQIQGLLLLRREILTFIHLCRTKTIGLFYG
jgi:hypothetical protein